MILLVREWLLGFAGCKPESGSRSSITLGASAVPAVRPAFASRCLPSHDRGHGSLSPFFAC